MPGEHTATLNPARGQGLGHRMDLSQCRLKPGERVSGPVPGQGRKGSETQCLHRAGIVSKPVDKKG